MCETYTAAEGSDNLVSVKERKVHTMNTPLSQGQFSAIEDRGISLEAAKAYGITVAGDKQIYPYYDVNGQHVANKVRHVKTKDFHAEGRLPQAGLFGQNQFRDGGKYITITEGELDAVSAYQMMGCKWPVVSVRNGAQSAVKDVKAQFEWLNKFENIVVCFDNDEHGNAAAAKVASIFEPNKICHRQAEGKGCQRVSQARQDRRVYQAVVGRSALHTCRYREPQGLRGLV